MAPKRVNKPLHAPHTHLLNAVAAEDAPCCGKTGVKSEKRRYTECKH